MSVISALVSALIGLKAVLPISLLQISSRITGVVVMLRPASVSTAAIASRSGEISPEGSPSTKRPLLASWISPGLITSAP
nr:hypothetical protein [Rhizobium leguminosarum]